jgi:hypothetical protein
VYETLKIIAVGWNAFDEKDIPPKKNVKSDLSHNQRNFYMKRIPHILILFTAILVFQLTACGASASSSRLPEQKQVKALLAHLVDDLNTNTWEKVNPD